jgi:hypothetical protein
MDRQRPASGRRKHSPAWLAAGISIIALTLPFSLRAQRPPEPGATPGVDLTNISNVPHDKFTSVFPMVAVSRGNPNLVAVAWRQFALPVDNFAPNYAAECHVSISKDGGKTYTAIDLMPYLRTEGDGSVEHPRIYGCNAPFAAIANDGTIYAGGGTLTEYGGARLTDNNGQGRVGVTVSEDGGKTWTKTVFGITMDRMAPGLTGMNGGTSPLATPWDGANGIVDPQTGTFYASTFPSQTRSYISASHDKGKTYGTVYSGNGTASAAFGTVITAKNMNEFEGAQCPCIVASISRNEGKTWEMSLVAQKDQYDRVGTVRYPTPSASPAKAGSYVISAYAPDHKSVEVFYTADYGKTWKMAAPRPIPPNIPFTTVNQVHAGYTTDGRILVTWRAWRNVAAHHTFVAMLDGDTFGPTIKVTPELSIDPPMTFAGYYQGDFTNWVVGNTTDAFVAFVFAPKGLNEDTWVARVPLSLLK